MAKKNAIEETQRRRKQCPPRVVTAYAVAGDAAGKQAVDDIGAVTACQGRVYFHIMHRPSTRHTEAETGTGYHGDGKRSMWPFSAILQVFAGFVKSIVFILQVLLPESSLRCP